MGRKVIAHKEDGLVILSVRWVVVCDCGRGSSSATCGAVFRMMPALALHVLMWRRLRGW